MMAKEPKTQTEEELDEMIDDSFPASDPPSTSPVKGDGAPERDDKEKS